MNWSRSRPPNVLSLLPHSQLLSALPDYFVFKHIQADHH